MHRRNNDGLSKDNLASPYKLTHIFFHWIPHRVLKEHTVMVYVSYRIYRSRILGRNWDKGQRDSNVKWPTINGARARFSSFSALGDSTYIHSAPSPTTHIFNIFILCLLLMRHISFHAFSYDAYFHSAPSPTMPIFFARVLLLRLFSFRAFSQYA